MKDRLVWGTLRLSNAFVSSYILSARPRHLYSASCLWEWGDPDATYISLSLGPEHTPSRV